MAAGTAQQKHRAPNQGTQRPHRRSAAAVVNSRCNDSQLACVRSHVATQKGSRTGAGKRHKAHAPRGSEGHQISTCLPSQSTG
eukprot:3280166-Prymnesium_polylepis.2